jgi:hypothetical protein
VRIHCYGCPATVSVDEALAEQGLKVAGWSVEDGQTLCRSCANARGLPDPRGLTRGSTAGEPPGTVAPAAVEPGPTPAEQVVLPPGAAILDAQTRAALARYSKQAWAWLAAAAAVLVISGAIAAHQSSIASGLLASGTHTPGVVVSSGSYRTDYYVVIDYVAQNARHQGILHESAGYEYQPGETLDVIYDPSDPTRFRTYADSNQSPRSRSLLVYGFMIGLGLLGTGIVVLCRPRRWRRLLAKPWRAYSATYIPGQRRRAGPGVQLTPLDDPATKPIKLRLAATLHMRSAHLTGERVLWVAGDTSSNVILAIPRTRELFAAMSLRGYPGRRWQTAQDRAQSPRRNAIRRVYLVAVLALDGILATAAATAHDWTLTTVLIGKAVIIAMVLLRAKAQAKPT